MTKEEAIRKLQKQKAEYLEKWVDYSGVAEAFDMAIEALSAERTAETEIVHCKDCRWGREACGNIECFVDSNIPPEYPGYEWFCPNGERRIDG